MGLVNKTKNQLIAVRMIMIIDECHVLLMEHVSTKELIGSTVTNPMGAYEYQLMSSAIPAGTTEIQVVAKGEVIRTLAVQN